MQLFKSNTISFIPMKKIAVSVVLFFLLTPFLAAQRMLGIATGNNDVQNSMYLNPANIAGCDEKLIVNLLYANITIDNNLGTLGQVSQLIRKLKKNNHSNAQVFYYNGNTQFSMLAPMADVGGPGIIFNLNDQNTLAFDTRIRMFDEFYNFNKFLYNAAVQQSGQASLNTTFKNFRWTVDMWSEAGFTYGGVLADNSKYKLKIGVKINLLGGIGYIALNGKNLAVIFTTGVDSFAANNADLDLASSIYEAGNNITGNEILSNIFGNGGRGFGGDAGVVLEIKDKNASDHGGSSTPYKCALSLAVTDIGSITYYNMFTSTITGSGYVTNNGLSSNVKNFNNLAQYLYTNGYNRADSTQTEQVYLPTALVSSFDYHVVGSFSTNILMITNIANDYNYGNKVFNQFTISPRIDTKKISIGLPVTYNTLTDDFRIGLGVRYGGFFLGSDDAKLFFMNKQYGCNLYFGGSVVIHKKKKEDDSY